MKKTIKGIDEFHFKLDRQTKKNLVSLPVFRNIRNFSGIIVKILGCLSEKLDSEHLAGSQRHSKYGLVHEDLKIERESIHVYLSHGLYRKLKLMHQDLNFYSIAQLLRWMLLVFLDFYNVYGDEVFSRLTELSKDWKKVNDTEKLTDKKVRQLLALIHEKQAKISLLNLYDEFSSPVRILRV